MTKIKSVGIFDPEGINPNPLNSLEYSDNYRNLAKFWSNLPAYQMGHQIVQDIKLYDVLLIKSGTGSGKTVLIPKFSLDALNYSGKIICTLPKKIITKKAAEFSAETLDVQLGDQVGYQFKGENMKSSKTLLLYSTDGSIISMLKSDPMLKSIDIVIIDEAHERKVNIDLLLYLLKNSMIMRKEKNLKPLKLIIMSATIDEQIFKKYYSDNSVGSVGSVGLAGSVNKLSFHSMELAGTPNHPIKSIYLENPIDIRSSEYLEKGKEIIEKIIKNINKNNSDYPEGDILFFVCTVSECNMVAEELGKSFPDCFTMGLYSGFDPQLEQYISSPTKFTELGKKFKRRLFVSTNVAESSLTIDGIVWVIDSGLELKVRFEPTSDTNIMKKDFITQAQMTQRKGRAGRTKPGICYHLYTLAQQKSTLKFPEPEIKNIDLKNTCMSMMKICSHMNMSPCNISKTIDMFDKFIEPPGEKFITNGFDFARTNQLIDENDQLNKLGKLILESRLDVMDGLSLLYAYNISFDMFKIVFEIITICSLIKSGPMDLFSSSLDKFAREKIIKKLKSNESEHVLLYNLYNYVESDKSSFDIGLYESIKNHYAKNMDKISKLYTRFDIKIDEINIKDFETNIINSFSYGYKSNRAFKTSDSNIFRFNGMKIDLSKSKNVVKPKSNSIIFYSNLLWNGKLNIMICSPYLLS
jgi:HrpA-like RNA helicase